MFYSAPKTWEDAEATCVSLGGHLATVRDEADGKEMGKEFGGFAYIGLKAETNTGNYVWQWVDNSYVTFTLWGQGEPNLFPTEKCVIMYNGETACNNVPCHQKFSFFCEK